MITLAETSFSLVISILNIRDILMRKRIDTGIHIDNQTDRSSKRPEPRGRLRLVDSQNLFPSKESFVHCSLKHHHHHHIHRPYIRANSLLDTTISNTDYDFIRDSNRIEKEGLTRCSRATRAPTHHQSHNASRNTALAGPSGLHPLRSWSLTQHIHILAQGLSQSTYPNRESSHGLVSSGLVLSHGCNWYDLARRIAFATTRYWLLTRNRHHINHTSRICASTRIRTQNQPSSHESKPEARSACACRFDTDNRNWRTLASSRGAKGDYERLCYPALRFDLGSRR